MSYSLVYMVQPYRHHCQSKLLLPSALGLFFTSRCEAAVSKKANTKQIVTMHLRICIQVIEPFSATELLGNSLGSPLSLPAISAHKHLFSHDR